MGKQRLNRKDIMKANEMGENINLHFHFCPGHSIPHTPTPPLIMAKVMNIKSLPHHPGGIHSEHNHTHAEEEEEGHSELTSITYYLQLPCLLSCLDPSVHSTIHPYLCGRWIHGHRLRYPQRTCMVTRRDLYLQEEQQQQLKKRRITQTGKHPANGTN